uniref:C2H2-type domain-containing protein n=2 Tax=Timema TaxID=61471 RepID=A0A7R9DHY9_TIMPO|nr:unnamed protein product [Timema poppensis]
MGTYMCPLCCGGEFLSRDSLRDHLLCYTESLYCPECGKCFESVVRLVEHLETACDEAHTGHHDSTRVTRTQKQIYLRFNINYICCGHEMRTEKKGMAKKFTETKYLGKTAREAKKEIGGADDRKCESLLINQSQVKAEPNYNFSFSRIRSKIKGEETFLMDLGDYNEDDDEDDEDIPENNVYFPNNISGDVIDISDNDADSSESDADSSEDDLSEGDLSEDADISEDDVDWRSEQVRPENNGSVESFAHPSPAPMFKCSVCPYEFTSVEEHIKLYHTQDEVELQVPKEVSKNLLRDGENVIKPISNNQASADETTDQKLLPDPNNDLEIPGDRQSGDVEMVGDHQNSPPELENDHVQCEPQDHDQATIDHGQATIDHGNPPSSLGEIVSQLSLEPQIKNLVSECDIDRENPAVNLQGVTKETLVCNRECLTYPTFRHHSCTAIVYSCDVCNETFRRKKDLTKHLLSEHNLPNSSLKKKDRLKTKDVSKPPLTLVCEACGTVFNNKRSHLQHKKMHLPKIVDVEFNEDGSLADLNCKCCTFVAMNKKGLRTHMIVHAPYKKRRTEPTSEVSVQDPSTILTADNLTCHMCDQLFERTLDLHEHFKTHYYNKEDEKRELAKLNNITFERANMDNPEKASLTFTCEICHLTLDKSIRVSHILSHSGDVRFTCEICNGNFYTREQFNLHMRAHNGDTPYMCRICKKRFADMHLLEKHSESHRENRNYPCRFCSKRFQRPSGTLAHERIHTGERPFTCQHCGLKFRLRGTRDMHSRIHTGVKPYNCEHCGMKFRSRYSFHAHVATHYDARDFKCTMCPKTFKTAAGLSSHKNNHTKPYACSVCKRKFNTSFAERKHRLSHSTGKNMLKYVCDLCGACYARSFGLRDHLIAHNEEAMGKVPTREDATPQNIRDSLTPVVAPKAVHFVEIEETVLSS